MGKENDVADQERAVRAETTVMDLHQPFSSCLHEGRLDACTIVILGASGDLTSRMLMPALYNLFVTGGLPDPFCIVGCARTPMEDGAFRKKMRDAIASRGQTDLSQWEAFSSRLHYRVIDYEKKDSFRDLAASLRRLDRDGGIGGNRIFYLAIPPALYEIAAQMIGEAGLSGEGKEGDGWSRIVVEKPFGRDLDTAKELDRSIREHFREHQIFRIDHYLAKETVQNILMFRFANAIFEPVWNRRYVDYVSIAATETVGVEHRAGYYEKSGVLRDMFQNHMMQLLALTAMEPPPLFEAERVQDEKIKVFRSLRPFPTHRIGDHLVLGQYGAGMIDGKAAPAYRDEPGVNPDSLTPTFAMMKVFLDNWRWQGIPFYLTSGKRMAEKRTQIAVQFKQVPHALFRETLEERISANRIILGIFPEEKITLTFQTKNPGARVCLRTVTMDFHYQQNYHGPILDAYEKALLDCMAGDHTLFWRQDGVEATWAFLSPILYQCEQCEDQRAMLRIYDAGSRGPWLTESLSGDRTLF